MNVRYVRYIYVLLFAIITSLAVLGASIYSINQIDSAVVNQIRDAQLIQTKHAVQEIESHIRRTRDELLRLSKFPEIASLDAAKCTSQIEFVHETIGESSQTLLLANKDGSVVACSSSLFSNYYGLNIQNKDYFAIPKQSKEPFIDVNVREGNNRQIIVAVPLFQTSKYTPYPNFQGEFTGVLFSVVELGNLYSLYIRPALADKGSSFMLVKLGSNETIIATEGIGNYSVLGLPEKPTVSVIENLNGINDFGKSIITASDITIGQEKWVLVIITPLSRAGNDRQLVTAGFYIIIISVGVLIVSLFALLLYFFSANRNADLTELRKQGAPDENNTRPTLESLGIKVEIQSVHSSKNEKTKPESDASGITKLHYGKLYLVMDTDEKNAHEIFAHSLGDGTAGIAIVKQDPRVLKKKYNLEHTSFIWMTDSKLQDVPSENNALNLLSLISEFVIKASKSVVLIDRLDYLLNVNKPEDLIRLVHNLKDLASVRQSIIILSANPELIDKQYLKIIESESLDVYGRQLGNKVHLSELESKILAYIIQRNNESRIVSFKDITSNFKITKPTTRAKLRHLYRLGLITVEQRGRIKALNITAAGRKLAEA